jgi:hypothetical protein
VEFVRDLVNEEFERRTHLSDRDRMAAEVLEAMQSPDIGLVGYDHADALESFAVPGAPGNDLERALRREIEECRRDPRRAEIAIAGRNSDGDRLRRIEEHQLRSESLRGEEAFLLADDGRHAPIRAHNADFCSLGRGAGLDLRRDGEDGTEEKSR